MAGATDRSLAACRERVAAFFVVVWLSSRGVVVLAEIDCKSSSKRRGRPNLVNLRSAGSGGSQDELKLVMV